MKTIRLETQRLDLIIQSVEETLARIAAMSPAEREHLSDDWLGFVHTTTSSHPWIHGFKITKRGEDVVVGECGFKGPPDSDGIVEIAYRILPDHRRLGYATEAAAALVAYALTNQDVGVVRAHTLPESNASTRVLEKCGFHHVEDVVDPVDGPVWRWEKDASAA